MHEQRLEGEDGVQTRVVNVRTEEYDVYIGRANPRYGLKRSKWANPFRLKSEAERPAMIERYREWIMNQPDLLARIHELRGKRLGCWCAPKPCHGDVLAELADRMETGRSGGAEG